MLNPANDNGDPVRFLSVCSGIEAASVAFGPLGWRAVAFSEIEKFPSAVLAHHYPDVPNLGDFTKIDTKTLGRVDILCGGTPCQAFSVAGLRGGLNDSRGNLTLAFVELAHELAAGNGLRNVVWENVVGVLSDKTNAFGSFLAGLVGADSALQPPTRGKWGNAGLVSGPKGRAAWRVVDAQYFGVAQRRRRVLVVADFGNGADPAQVLFELEGVQRHSPPSREAGKDVAPTISARTKGGGGLGTDFDLDGGVIEVGYAPEIARCVATREGSSQDYETTTMVAHAIQAGALRTNPNSGPDGVGVQEGIAYTLEARSEVQAVCVTGDIAHTLKAEGADASEDGTGRGTPIIAFSSKDYGGDASFDVSPTLRAGGHSGSHANAGVMPAIAFDTTQITSAANRSNPQPGDPCHPLSAGAHPPAVTVALRGHEGGATAELGREVATALRASTGGGDKPHVLTSAVRRLTPTECERLQGFPDNYSNIPWRGKPTSPDGPRYKALGNSWAVPKFTWLGRRIAMHMPARSSAPVITRSEAA